MRDEDLKGIPQSMTRAARDALLAACGITELENLASFSMDYRGISAVVYATDEKGSRIRTLRPTEIDVTELGDAEPTKVPGPWESEIVTHTIYIPFVDEAKEPDPRPDSMDLAPEDRERITAAVDAEHAGPLCRAEHEHDWVTCSKPKGHDGRHTGTGDDGGAYAW